MSGFLVAEKNSSETDETASHPTLERTIVRMKTNLSGFFSSKATRVQQIVKLTVKQERDTGKLQVKIDLGLHLFSIKTNYLKRHLEYLTTPWWLHEVLELNMVSWVISMQGGEFLTKVNSSRDATLLHYFPTPSSKPLSSFHSGSHVVARSKAVICWRKDRLFF